MENCVRCGISGDSVRLFDAVYLGKIEKICERCSIIENVPVIRTPGSRQLIESEKTDRAYNRMRSLSGMKGERKNDSFFMEDRLKELERRPELEMPEKNKLNLIDHFHWEIMTSRRRKGFSQEKLAETIGESVTAIQMLEKEKFPENADIVIKKLEQFFRVRLRKMSAEEKMMMERKNPILLNDKGDELDLIPEPEVEIIEEFEPELHCEVKMKKDSNTPLLDDEAVVECKVERKPFKFPFFGKKKIDESEPIEIVERGYEPIDLRGIDRQRAEVDIHKINSSEVKISDLRELHRKKIEATKQEKEEEQRRIVERQKLIEARKEELRNMREKESKELDNYLGGTELLRKDQDENNDFEEK